MVFQFYLFLFEFIIIFGVNFITGMSRVKVNCESRPIVVIVIVISIITIITLYIFLLFLFLVIFEVKIRYSWLH